LLNLTMLFASAIATVTISVPSRMITFPLGDQRCSWQDRF
jgi:hypothetical protein